jgi:hypothetical protein
MIALKNSLKNNLALLLIFAVLLCVGIGSAAFNLLGNDQFERAKSELLFRKIGHDLLTYAGDSTSRVLPVTKINELEFKLKFANEFAFMPDSLVAIVNRSLAKNTIGKNYVVNVINCDRREVVFGYAIFERQKDNILPCTGRIQAKGCYEILIKFEKTEIGNLQKNYLLGGIPLLAIIGLIISRPYKRKNSSGGPDDASTEIFKIGNGLFNLKERQLIFGETITLLTLKEAKLLHIFVLSPNMVVPRNRLQKEIWEDEGVIVGRSLDMFISKLRKKLADDPSIQLTNVHGKGYKLEIGNDV